MKWVALSDIVIREEFANSTPRKSKIDRIRAYYEEYGGIDKPLTINKWNVLLDGYIRYLILKENGAEYAKCQIARRAKKKIYKVKEAE